MKSLALGLAIFASATLATAAQYQTDRGTTSFLHYNLVSGGEFYYPPEAEAAKLSGTGFFLMRLRADGDVDSITLKMSTGHKILDEAVTGTLRTYRFKANTKGPLLWLVGFIYPSTVIVKITARIKEAQPTPPPEKIIRKGIVGWKSTTFFRLI